MSVNHFVAGSSPASPTTLCVNSIIAMGATGSNPVGTTICPVGIIILSQDRISPPRPLQLLFYAM